MHKQVVFINRLLQPNKISTIARNKTYLSYIAEKENVFRNTYTEHGLWGYIKEIPDIDTNNSLKKVQEYVNKISKEKKNIYRGIISISEQDAVEKGFEKKEKWEELVKIKLPEFASKINIPSDRLEYVASIHLDRGHPHVHIMFWDREQEIQKNFIHSKISDNFRISLNKYIFNEEYTEALKQRDEVKEKFIYEEKELENILLKEIEGKNIDIDVQNNNDFFYQETMFLDRIPKEEIKDIVKDILELRKELPKTGSINYKYLSKDLKLIQKIDNISLKILNASPSLKKEFYKYIEKSKKIAEISGNTNPKVLKKIEGEAKKDLLKQIGNKVLNIERQVIRKEQLEEKEKIEFENNLLQGISEMISIFSQLNQSNDYNIKNNYKNKDLTKEQRQELAKRLSDRSSIEW